MTPSLLSAAVLTGGEGESKRLAALLEASGVEVLEWAWAELGSDGALDPSPDVVVVSCVDPAADAKREVRELKRRLPAIPIVAIVRDEDSSRSVRRALEANAEGVVFGARVDEALVPAMRAVSAGQIVLPQSEYRHAKPVVLSHREREVLRLAVKGMTNDAIAKTLYISRSTVKSHLTSAFAKLSVRSRSEAALVLSNPDEPATRLVFDDRGRGGSEVAGSLVGGSSR